jgi:hypothetical protein
MGECFRGLIETSFFSIYFTRVPIKKAMKVFSKNLDKFVGEETIFGILNNPSVKDYFKNLLIFNKLQSSLKTGIIFAQIKSIHQEWADACSYYSQTSVLCRGVGAGRKSRPCPRPYLPQALYLVWYRAAREYCWQRRNFRRKEIHGSRTKASERLEFQR